MEQNENVENAVSNSMKIRVRECKTFVSDSGAKVEQYTVLGDIALDYTPKDENEKQRIEEYGEKTFFFGNLVLGTESGPKEVKFSIPEANNLQEAFEQFSQNAEEVVKNLQKQREEYIKKIQAQQKQQQNVQPPVDLKGFKKSDVTTTNKVKDQLNIVED